MATGFGDGRRARIRSREDGLDTARLAIVAVDREAVVVDDAADGIGDLFEDLARIQSRHQLLADMEKPAFARQLALEGHLLLFQAGDVGRVLDGLARISPEDRQRLLVLAVVSARIRPSTPRARRGPRRRRPSGPGSNDSGPSVER